MRFITFAARNVEHGCSRSDQSLSIDVHLQYSSCLEWLVAWTIPWWLESAVIVTVPLARTLCGLTAAYWTVNDNMPELGCPSVERPLHGIVIQ